MERSQGGCLSRCSREFMHSPGSSKLNDISSLLEPQSVAVIGASSNPEKSGHVLLKSIIVNRYKGQIYPINPHAEEILGYKAYKNILDVPGTIDLVFFLLPGQYIEDMVEHCKQKG